MALVSCPGNRFYIFVYLRSLPRICAVKFVRWNQSYSTSVYPDNNYYLAIAVKNKAIILAAVAVAAAIGLIYFRIL